MKTKIFSVTIDDCRVDTYRGSGKGGQKRNKTSSAVRVYHEPSRAMGQAEDGRSQHQNKKLAFGRMARSEEMQKWLRLEAARRTGDMAKIEAKVEKEVQAAKVEKKDDNGRWVPFDYEGLAK